MDFIVENAIPKDITVRQLINKLLDCPMDDLIIVKDMKDEELHGVKVVSRKHEDTLGALFG